MHAQICESIGDTKIGEVLTAVTEKDCEWFYERYLNDFVRTVNESENDQKLKNLEDQVRMYTCEINTKPLLLYIII